MRALFCLGIFFLAGCATHQRQPKFDTNDSAAEDRKFFWGEWWHSAPSEDDAEDKRFFYGGSQFH